MAAVTRRTHTRTVVPATLVLDRKGPAVTRLALFVTIAALALAAFAFLAAVVSGFTAPAWVLVTAVLLLGVALILLIIR